MHYINKDTRRYILLGAILVLVCFTLRLHYAYADARYKLLQEKRANVTYTANHICKVVDYLVERDGGGWEAKKYKDVFSFLVGELDATANAYAELFDDQFNKLSERTPVFPSRTFDIEEFPELKELLLADETGNYVVWFDPMDGKTAPHDLYLYWRWVPTGKHHENRLLLIVGCTKYSVSAELADWAMIDNVALLFISMSIIIVCMMMLSVDRRVSNQSRKGGCRRVG